MRTQVNRVNTVANNIANVSNPGFRRLMLVEMPGGNQNLVDNRPGMVQYSANPLDLAIEGSGFFVTEGQDGFHLTRDGRFHRGTDGMLRASSGEVVLGLGGGIKVKPGDVEITPEGQVRQAGKTIGRLRVVEPAKYSLVPTGAGGYGCVEMPPAARNTKIKSCALETSNVDALEEITTLMGATRELEVAQKAYVAVGDMSKKLSEDVGRSR